MVKTLGTVAFLACALAISTASAENANPRSLRGAVAAAEEASAVKAFSAGHKHAMIATANMESRDQQFRHHVVAMEAQAARGFQAASKKKKSNMEAQGLPNLDGFANAVTKGTKSKNPNMEAQGLPNLGDFANAVTKGNNRYKNGN